MEKTRCLKKIVYGILGIINILGDNFLVAITDKKYVGKLEYASIYMVDDVELFPFNLESIPKCRQYMDGIRSLLKSGFYFSYYADLSSNKQRASRLKKEGFSNNRSLIWELSD